MNRLPILLAFASAFALFTACRAPRDVTPTDAPVFVETLAGPRLEQLDLDRLHPVGGRRLFRPERTEGFRVRTDRVRITSTSGARGDVTASLWAGRPGPDTRFFFRCPRTSDARLHWSLFTGRPGRDTSGAELELRIDNTRYRVLFPLEPRRLVHYALPLQDRFCRDGEEAAVTVAATDLPARFRMTPPFVTIPAPVPEPSVFLISIDALRADAWTPTAGRVPSLDAFYQEASRFVHAYTSFPTTSRSHGVILTGLFPDELETAPLDRMTSVAGVLHDHGRISLGLVAGGLLRARFGYGGRPPGFALGFDLYLEDLPPTEAPDSRRRPRARSAARGSRPPPRGGSHRPGALEFKTETLGAALARSLAWLEQDPGVPAFHFIHGYDVHDYRTAPVAYWQQAVEARVAAGLDPSRLDACVRAVGLRHDRDMVEHFPPERMYRMRMSGHLGALEPCHRLVTRILYEARVRSVQDMLGRYLEGLRRLQVYDNALIIVTSDHGESLLDEQDRTGAYQWGHNRILMNNLRVPLWIKPPGATRGSGRDVEDVVGLVDLRTTILETLGIATRADRGTNILTRPGSRAGPIRFASSRGDRGVVLADGTICVRDAPWGTRTGRFEPRKRRGREKGPGGLEPRELEEGLRIHDVRGWHAASGDEARRCTAAMEEEGAGGRVSPMEIPRDMERELRALGYVE